MRITDSSIIKRYGTTLNSTLERLDRLNKKVVNSRKFDSFSEDTSGAVRAMRIRSQMNGVEGYQSNLQKSRDILTEVEASMMTSSNLVTDARVLILKAVNGSQGEAERSVIAQELRSISDQIFTNMNAQFSDQFLFGGTSLDEAPLKLDGGRLLYKGVDVATMERYDGTNWVALSADEIAALESDPFYIDVGLGLRFESAASRNVVPQSAMNISFTAIGVMGYGQTAGGLNNNVYLLINDIADALESPSYDSAAVDGMADHLQSRFNEMNVKVTEMGSRSKYISDSLERFDTQMYNLKVSQNELEFDDPAAVITEFKMQEMAYRAALQMGTRILQTNIFDFMT